MTDKIEVDSFFDHIDKTPKKIDDYKIIKSLGVGGMGEVFLAYDPHCERLVALKKIKTQLISHPIIKKRFMKEARFASKLTHPNIIPIYSIHEGHNNVYYTMPYIEGETLKEIIKSTKFKEKKGEAPHEIGVSIPSLARIFLSVCQAVSYSHSKGILHRDLKPENIIVGKFGEVFLLDWGIATDIKKTNNEDIEEDIAFENSNLTSPGKILGTVNYMAPERAFKNFASIPTEIYALGVILYQILTLSFPFRRKDLEHFKRIMKFERILPPEEQAPYRDIPKQLSELCLKCLSFYPEHRYISVNEIITDLKDYIEGRPEWIFSTELNIKDKNHWEFQENILLSQHMAITRIIDLMEWIALMISKNPFPGNIKIEFDIQLPKKSHGIGLLLCVPEQSERKDLQEGFCLWLGSPAHPHLTLFRSNAELYSIPHIEIKSDGFSHIIVEKIDNGLKLFIDGHIKLNYISHIPIIGTHIGFCYKDLDFNISSLKIYSGSQNVMVNCLSVPDILLSSKNFSKAFIEYKKIAQSFEGRTEGKEAQFRAGLTLLEEAKCQISPNDKQNLLAKAFDEFEKLKSTSAAPLEYLGKSLIYHVESEIEEEIKCLELCIRKFIKHPLLQIIKEQVIFRLHESSNNNRMAAYLFALMALRLLPEIFISHENLKFIQQLVKHSPHLNFIDYGFNFSEKRFEYLHIAVILCFWLKKPKILCEILDIIPENIPEKKYILINGLLCLYYMNTKDVALDKYQEFSHYLNHIDNNEMLYYLRLYALLLSTSSLPEKIDQFFTLINQTIQQREFRFFLALVKDDIQILSFDILSETITKFSHYTLDQQSSLELKILMTKAFLYLKEKKQLEKLFENFDDHLLKNYKSPLCFYYGCYLYLGVGKKKSLDHFKSIKAEYPLPMSLAINIILEKISLEDLKKFDLFDFETRQTYEYLCVYYHVSNNKKKLKEIEKLKEVN